MRMLLGALLLVGCSAAARPRVDAAALQDDTGAASDGGTDGSVDASLDLADAFTPDDAATATDDAFMPDATTVPDDAFVGADSAPGELVGIADICPRILAEFRMFPCGTVVFNCPYTSNTYEWNVAHCVSEISDVYYTPALAGARTGCEAINLLLHNRVPTACNN